MNRTLLTIVPYLAVLAAATAAPIPLTGSAHYLQDFNVLATATNTFTSTTTWADDSTIPGWSLYKASTGLVGAAYTYRVSNGLPGQGNAGGLVDTGHFYSIGALNDPGRALGAVPITGQGEHSVIAVFENRGTAAIRLQNIAYDVEIRRTNQNANVVETIAVWWKKDLSATAFFTNTTATATATDFPAAVSTGPSGLYVTGWNRAAEADYTTSSAQANTQVDVRTPVNAAVLNEIRVDPGEFLALRWGNINDSGADTLMGIDDVDLTFASAAGGIAGTVANVARSNEGTSRIPGDDTVSFDLTVNSSGAPGAGWTITSPPALAGTTGTYGFPVSITGQPIAGFTGASHVFSLAVADQTNPAITAPVQVVAPWCQITPTAAVDFLYLDKGTVVTTDDEVSYTVKADGEFTGTSYDLGTAGTAAYATPLPVTAAAPGTFATHTFTDSADPSCTATLHVFPPGIIGTNATTPTSLPLFSQPVAQNGDIRWTINGSARTLVQTGNPLQADHVLLSEIVDLTAVPEVAFTATLTTVGGASGFEAQDSFALDLIIDGGAPVSVLGASDTDADGRLRGTIELPVGAAPDQVFNFSYPIPAAATSVQVRLTGNSNSPNELFTVSAMEITLPPGPSIIGSLDLGAGSVPVFTDAAAPPDAAWVINAAAGIISMNDGDVLAAGDKVVTSEVVNLAAATGPVLFTANLHVNDKTGGFETEDNFIAVLIYDGDTANPVSVVDAYDADVSGRMNGAELCPVPPVNPTVQDFDYPLSAVIPDNVLTVQLIITGLNDSPNETMTVSSIRFGQSAPDGDGDGMSDDYETNHGLNPASPLDRDLDPDGDGQSNLHEFLAGTAANDASSSLRITTASVNEVTGAASVTWSSIAGRRYRLQFATGPAGPYADTGALVTAAGPGTTGSATIPGAPLTGHGFLRVKVVP